MPSSVSASPPMTKALVARPQERCRTAKPRPAEKPWPEEPVGGREGAAGFGGEAAGAMQDGEAQAGGEAVAGGAGGGVGEGVLGFHMAAGSAPTAEAGELLGEDQIGR